MNVNMVWVHDIEIQQQKIHSMMTQKKIFFLFISSEKHVAIDLDKTFGSSNVVRAHLQ